MFFFAIKPPKRSALFDCRDLISAEQAGGIKGCESSPSIVISTVGKNTVNHATIFAGVIFLFGGYEAIIS
jgi:hypothetical protein